MKDAVTNSHNNTAVGFESMVDAGDGATGNSAFGKHTLKSITTGDNNFAAGVNAGYSITTGSNNVVIGQADISNYNGTRQIVIGHQATGKGNNMAVIGDSQVTELWAAEDGQATVYAGGLVLEGATADAHETTLGVVDPTADATLNLPAMSAGTYYVPVLAAASTTAITSTPEELNIMDGSTIQATVTLAGTDGIVISDGNVMKQALVSDIASYVSSSGNAATATTATNVTILDNESTNENNAIVFTSDNDLDGGNIGLESDGTLNYNPSTGTLTTTTFVGNITGNVVGNVIGDVTGNIAGNASGTAATVTGSAQSNITSLGTLTALTVDNLGVDGNTITANSGAVNITPAAGSAIVLDGTVNVDAGVITGATSITSTAFVGDITGNVTGNTSGTAATVTGSAQSNITSLGTLTALTVDNLGVDGNTITANSGAVNITPAAGSAIVLDGTVNVDAGVITGATSITSTAFVGDITGNVTGNTSGTAATVTGSAQSNITSLGTLTALTVDNLGVDGNTITANSGAVNITPAAGSAIVLDGTVNVDAGVITGATSITSTAFVGDITGNVTGNTSGTAATVTGSAQSNITSLGTLTTLTVDNVITNGTTIGHTDDIDLLTLATDVVTVAGEVAASTLDISGNGDIDGTLTVASGAIISSPNANSVYIGKAVTNTAQYNTGIGKNIFNSLNGGTDNAAIGYDGLAALTSGQKNVGAGSNALKSVNTGQGNIGIGYFAGGDYNSGDGTALTTGSDNTIIGYDADVSASDASNQIVIGKGATGGGDNTVVLGNGSITNWLPTDDDEVSLGSSSKEMDNIYVDGVAYTDAIGFGTVIMELPTSDGSADQVLKTDGSGNLDWVDSGSGASAVDGLSDAKLAGTDFTGSMILGHQTTGTLDAAEYNLGIGATALDAITTGDGNVAIGYDALTNVNTGYDNVAIGYNALNDQTTGYMNIAIGEGALEKNTTTSMNIAIGESALDAQTNGGERNIGIGVYALTANTTGDYNLALGYGSMYYNTSGGSNVSLGQSSMSRNQTGGYNTVVGRKAMEVSFGSNNVAVGYEAMNSNWGNRDNGNSTFAGNVALGYQSGEANESGDYNVFIGYQAGDAITTGNDNVIIGKDAAASAVAGTNQIIIGKDATGLGDNYAVIGNADIERVYIAQDGAGVLYADGTIQTSDERLKENILSLNHGLDFIMKLNPVSYLKMKLRDYLNFSSVTSKSMIYEIGLLAQEVKEISEELDFDNRIVTIGEDGIHRMDYQKIMMPLIKATQEQQQIIESQQKMIEDLKENLKRLEKLIIDKK